MTELKLALLVIGMPTLLCMAMYVLFRLLQRLGVRRVLPNSEDPDDLG